MGPDDVIEEGRAVPFLAHRTQRGKALLVHEDPEALRFYGNLLERRGYQVRACRCYEEGLNCLGSGVFDFVMVSQGGRGFEGRCVVERAVEINRRLPVLVTARCLDMTCYLEAMQLGAADYLAEPVNFSEVERVLRNHRPTLSTVA
jgi:DNA-binding NtrC family response regulator